MGSKNPNVRKIVFSYSRMCSLKLGNIGSLVSFNSESSKMVIKRQVEVVIENGNIIDIGEKLGDADSFIDCGNNLVTPGFVDSHTHPVFVDTREEEFEMRVSGLSYQEIHDRGGGILNSTKLLRESSETILISKVKSRMDTFLSLGTTTVECKSGYGLDTVSELKSLMVIDKVNKKHEIDMIPTFMGGHDFPIDFQNDKDAYVDLICNTMIPKVAKQGIAKFNDVFCEPGYFNIEQSKRILETGEKYGLLSRMHCDEFSCFGASNLAAKLKVNSADHLMEIDKEGMDRLAQENIIGTLLPGTTFFLGRKKYAPYLELKNKGVEIAIASDYNSGSCNIQSMPFIITLSCIYLKMNILDALKASTIIPSKSLRIDNTVGSIEKGKIADILVWGIPDIKQIPFSINQSNINLVLKKGKPVFTA